MPGWVKHLVGMFPVLVVLVLAPLVVASFSTTPPVGTSKPTKRSISGDNRPASATPPDDALQEDAWGSEAEAAARRAIQWVLDQQAADGGWHSQSYAVLRSGQALTPFILHALFTLPDDLRGAHDQQIAKALEFIRTQVNSEGALGLADADILEYPNYATAYALMCLVQAGDPQDQDLVARMRDYLIGQQFTVEQGFDPSTAAFGGWGFGGPRSPGSPGHMDLAHTRRVLAALDQVGSIDAEVFARATDFLRYVQRHPDDQRPQPLPPGFKPIPQRFSLAPPFDGGFYFSPVVLDANKGRVAISDDDDGRASSAGDPSPSGAMPYYRSYATATCDGVLALLAAGVSPQDPRVIAALEWLKSHRRLDYPEGIPLNHPDPWGGALYYYHLAVRSEVYQALGWPEGSRQEMAELLMGGQSNDGSFVNRRSHLMKEDDPLLATTLAVIALSRVLDRTTTPVAGCHVHARRGHADISRNATCPRKRGHGTQRDRLR